jgi:molybdopterin-guanine dinucleotide biosynthesis protein A
MPQPRAVVLAGGRSRRFGSNKVWANFQSKPMIVTLIDTLRSCGFSISISGPPSTLSSLGYPVIPDHLPHEGPLCALQRVLEQLPDAHVLLAAVDMPALHPDVVKLLWSRRAHAQIVGLEDSDGRPHPLPAVYSRRILPTVSTLVAAGERRLGAVLRHPELQTEKLQAPHWQVLDPRGQTLRNINTPEALANLETLPPLGMTLEGV